MVTLRFFFRCCCGGVDDMDEVAGASGPEQQPIQAPPSETRLTRQIACDEEDCAHDDTCEVGEEANSPDDTAMRSNSCERKTPVGGRDCGMPDALSLAPPSPQNLASQGSVEPLARRPDDEACESDGANLHPRMTAAWRSLQSASPPSKRRYDGGEENEQRQPGSGEVGVDAAARKLSELAFPVAASPEGFIMGKVGRQPGAAQGAAVAAARAAGSARRTRHGGAASGLPSPPAAAYSASPAAETPPRQAMLCSTTPRARASRSSHQPRLSHRPAAAAAFQAGLGGGGTLADKAHSEGCREAVAESSTPPSKVLGRHVADSEPTVTPPANAGAPRFVIRGLPGQHGGVEIVGVPNTTTKYREDRHVRVFSTPFEKRVDRSVAWEQSAYQAAVSKLPKRARIESPTKTV